MRDVVILLIGVLAGALVQAATGWLSDRRADNREHSQWLRERRYEIYREITEKVSEFMWRKDEAMTPVEQVEHLGVLYRLMGPMNMFGTKAARDALDDALRALGEVGPEGKKTEEHIVARRKMDVFDRLVAAELSKPIKPEKPLRAT